MTYQPHQSEDTALKPVSVRAVMAMPILPEHFGVPERFSKEATYYAQAHSEQQYNMLTALARQMAEWHAGDSDECGIIARATLRELERLEKR